MRLIDCKDGLLTQDASSAEIESDLPGTLTIDASRNGVSSSGTSTAILSGIGVDIFGDANGILATDFSSVDIIPTGSCTIEGGGSAVVVEDDASVTTSDCSLIDGMP